jgi:hypothetical protein
MAVKIGLSSTTNPNFATDWDSAIVFSGSNNVYAIKFHASFSLGTPVIGEYFSPKDGDNNVITDTITGLTVVSTGDGLHSGIILDKDADPRKTYLVTTTYRGTHPRISAGLDTKLIYSYLRGDVESDYTTTAIDTPISGFSYYNLEPAWYSCQDKNVYSRQQAGAIATAYEGSGSTFAPSYSSKVISYQQECEGSIYAIYFWDYSSKIGVFARPNCILGGTPSYPLHARCKIGNCPSGIKILVPMNSTDYWIGLADNNRTFVLYRVGNVATSVIQEEQSGGFDIDTTFNWDLSVAWELQEYIFSGSIALVTNGWTHGLSSSYCYRRVHNTTSIKEGANQVVATGSATKFTLLFHQASLVQIASFDTQEDVHIFAY